MSDLFTLIVDDLPFVKGPQSAVIAAAKPFTTRAVIRRSTSADAGLPSIATRRQENIIAKTISTVEKDEAAYVRKWGCTPAQMDAKLAARRAEVASSTRNGIASINDGQFGH